MIAYQHDANGYYAGEIEDYGGPIPNNATRIPPQERNGYVPCWAGTTWEQVENHKGEEGYMDGTPYTIKDYGPLPEGWSDTPPDPTPEERAAQRRMEILTRLKDIDADSVRPLRAMANGEAAEEDRAKLAALDVEAVALRAELAGLPRL